MKDTQSVCFSISGEWMTEHIRERWAESSYSNAIKILECLEGTTHEQHLDIIFGRKKLVGINDLELVDDDWKPSDDEDYPDFAEAMRRGDNWRELEERREDEAWSIANNEWPWTSQKLGSKSIKCPTWEKVVRLVGETKADKIFHDVMMDKADSSSWNRKYESDRTYETRDSIADLYADARDKISSIAGTDATVPTVDAMMNRGMNLPMTLDPSMSSPSGWLLRDGKYYGCGCMEHMGLASTILKSLGKTEDEDAEKIAENLGWVKISKSISGLYIFCLKKVSQKQLDKLFDYSTNHGLNYEKIISSLQV